MRQLLGLAFGCIVLAGCGGGDFPTAKTTGTVLCNGAPVEYALVYFEPLKGGESAMVGKGAVGITDADGKFTLMTYSDGDGAVVGKHRVRVGPPQRADWECDCKTDAEFDLMEVEIKSDGSNDFTLELPKKERRDRRQVVEGDEDEDED